MRILHISKYYYPYIGGVEKRIRGQVPRRGSGDRYLNHLYTIEKWHVQQESIQIAESITLY